MSEVISKHDVLFERDDKGELLPVKVELKSPFSGAVLVRPIPRGALLKMFSDAKNDPNDEGLADEKTILKYCIEPRLSEEEVKRLKTSYAMAIVAAIMDVSLGTPDDKPKAVQEAEELLKKKSV